MGGSRQQRGADPGGLTAAAAPLPAQQLGYKSCRAGGQGEEGEIRPILVDEKLSQKTLSVVGISIEKKRREVLSQREEAPEGLRGGRSGGKVAPRGGWPRLLRVTCSGPGTLDCRHLFVSLFEK